MQTSVPLKLHSYHACACIQMPVYCLASKSHWCKLTPFLPLVGNRRARRHSTVYPIWPMAHLLKVSVVFIKLAAREEERSWPDSALPSLRPQIFEEEWEYIPTWWCDSSPYYCHISWRKAVTCGKPLPSNVFALHVLENKSVYPTTSRECSGHPALDNI